MFHHICFAAFSKSESVPFALQEKIPNRTSGPPPVYPGNRTQSSFQLFCFIYYGKTQRVVWFWWWSWILVVVLLLGICDRFRSVRVPSLFLSLSVVPQPNRAGRFVVVSVPCVRRMQAVSRNLMTSWNNSLTLVQPLPPAVPLLSHSGSACAQTLLFPFQPNQTTFRLVRVPLSRRLRLRSSRPVKSVRPNSFHFLVSCVLLLSRALVFAFLRFLFLIYIYILFLQKFTQID